MLDGMDVSLILFDGEISIENSVNDFWEMLLGVFTLTSSCILLLGIGDGTIYNFCVASKRVATI